MELNFSYCPRSSGCVEERLYTTTTTPAALENLGVLVRLVGERVHIRLLGSDCRGFLDRVRDVEWSYQTVPLILIVSQFY